MSFYKAHNIKTPTPLPRASEHSGAESPKRITAPQRRILNFLFSQPDGAGIKKISYETGIRPGRVLKLLEDLELAGEVFRCKGKWRSTALAMKLDPRPVVEKLRDELERDLFGPEPTPKIRSFLEEFAAGAKLGLDIDECFHFAQRKTLGAPQAAGGA